MVLPHEAEWIREVWADATADDVEFVIAIARNSRDSWDYSESLYHWIRSEAARQRDEQRAERRLFHAIANGTAA